MQEKFASTVGIIMNDPIEMAAKQLKEIVESCRTLAEAIQKDDEDEKLFCLTVIGLVHQYLFKDSSKKAVMLIKKLEKSN